ncbi:uncharacterized protein LOC132065561 isoform X4 [Lycium ferocissimum]|uniref:uncharacterized protein LOC132065561 isoform X4 n=1 Tax=Lycium ferocissimum TaxID=112874 RepID=UPI002815B226|nr:uncharacterized protein LOC132065561 isoform X4 [Lycium ferocissimum]XP_059314987.1 uncharacterized protein LOC132065561 isoform X4 [Lycium ferocissimum]XP_059314988.1 uncharacterized protein LOC132065561 isoform X4 [Lycium ferocissimum]
MAPKQVKMDPNSISKLKFKLPSSIEFFQLYEDDPAEPKLDMLFISSSRQAEEPSCPETSTPTSSFWSSRAKRRGFFTEGES